MAYPGGGTGGILTPAQFEAMYKDIFPAGSEVVRNVQVTSDTYSDIMTLDTGDIPEGNYILTLSMAVSNPDTNDSLYFQVTGDSPSPEFSIEAKDRSDVVPWSYTVEYEHAGGSIVSTLQVRKEDTGAQVINIVAAHFIYHRVG